MPPHESTKQRRDRYDRENRTLISRAQLGTNPRIEPPADVERPAFSQPCFHCEARGECRHRRAHAL